MYPMGMTWRVSIACAALVAALACDQKPQAPESAEAAQDGAGTLRPAPAPSAPASAPTLPAPATGAARDSSKLAWKDVLASLDTTSFSTVNRPNYRKAPAEAPMFVGMATAPDGSIMVVGDGPAADDIRAVSVVFR